MSLGSWKPPSHHAASLPTPAMNQVPASPAFVSAVPLRPAPRSLIPLSAVGPIAVSPVQPSPAPGSTARRSRGPVSPIRARPGRRARLPLRPARHRAEPLRRSRLRLDRPHPTRSGRSLLRPGWVRRAAIRLRLDWGPYRTARLRPGAARHWAGPPRQATTPPSAHPQTRRHRPNGGTQASSPSRTRPCPASGSALPLTCSRWCRTCSGSIRS